VQHEITKNTEKFKERGSSLFCEDFIACFWQEGKENPILIASSVAKRFRVQASACLVLMIKTN
jgi:hypothetical protein